MPPEDVPDVVASFLGHCREPESRRRVLAFYGGSFTGIDDALLERYLTVARSLVDDGVVHGCKASTRPDMVSAEMVERLKKAGFVELELGAQSLDDRVLKLSGRGHTAAQTVDGARLVRDGGLKLGLQIMPGLPGEDRESFRRTVAQVLACRPDTSRIYPTVVLEHTALARSWRDGRFAPLSLDEAVERTLYARLLLEQGGCTILRVGLPPSDDLEVLDGPAHPAFGFLVQARTFALMLRAAGVGPGDEVRVHPRDMAALVGHHGSTRKDVGFVPVGSETVEPGTLQTGNDTENTCVTPQDIIEFLL